MSNKCSVQMFDMTKLEDYTVDSNIWSKKLLTSEYTFDIMEETNVRMEE